MQRPSRGRSSHLSNPSKCRWGDGRSARLGQAQVDCDRGGLRIRREGAPVGDAAALRTEVKPERVAAHVCLVGPETSTLRPRIRMPQPTIPATRVQLTRSPTQASLGTANEPIHKDMNPGACRKAFRSASLKSSQCCGSKSMSGGGSLRLRAPLALRDRCLIRVPR